MHESSHRIGDSYRFQTVPNPEDNEQPDHVSRPGSACSDSTPSIWKASQLESCCEFEVLHEAALNDLDCLELGPQKWLWIWICLICLHSLALHVAGVLVRRHATWNGDILIWQGPFGNRRTLFVCKELMASLRCSDTVHGRFHAVTQVWFWGWRCWRLEATSSTSMKLPVRSPKPGDKMWWPCQWLPRNVPSSVH